MVALALGALLAGSKVSVIFIFGAFLCVSTARTPGAASAALASSVLMRPLAMAPCTMKAWAIFS